MFQKKLKLNELINFNLERYSEYMIVSTYFLRSENADKNPARVNLPKDEIEYQDSVRVDTPIIDVAKDKHSQAICLKTIPERVEKINEFTPLFCPYFIEKILLFEVECSEYVIFSSSWSFIEGNLIRLDTPVVSILLDDKEKKICMVEIA